VIPDQLHSMRLLAKDIAVAFGRYAERGARRCAQGCDCPLEQLVRATDRFYTAMQDGARVELLTVLHARALQQWQRVRGR